MRIAALAMTLVLGAALLAQADLATAKPHPRAGALDRSFGEEGRVATVLPEEVVTEELAPPWSLLAENESNIASKPQTALATGNDGSVAVAMGNDIFRYLPDGALDRSWGRGGEVALDMVEGLPFRLSDVAIDSEGRVLAFGSALDLGYRIEMPQYWIPFTTHPSFAVALRFGSNGALDPTYGRGDGVFRGDLGAHPPQGSSICRQPSNSCTKQEFDPSTLSLVGVRSAALDSAGRAVITVQQVGDSPTAIRSSNKWLVHTVARLTPDGELDGSFGGGVMDLGAGHVGNLSEPAIDDQDGVLLARERILSPLGAEEGWEPRMAEVVRLLPSGALDPTLGTSGAAHVLGGADAVATDGRGGMLVLQPASNPKAEPGLSRQALVRLKSDGTLDRSFGRRGKAWVTLPGPYSSISSLAIDRHGRILLAGTIARATYHLNTHIYAPTYFSVIRLLASGKPDRSFGHGGWVRTGFGRHTLVRAEGLALLPHDRLLVSGYGRSPELQPGGVVAVRYLLGR